jgi:hypothetical protein
MSRRPLTKWEKAYLRQLYPKPLNNTDLVDLRFDLCSQVLHAAGYGAEPTMELSGLLASLGVWGPPPDPSWPYGEAFPEIEEIP